MVNLMLQPVFLNLVKGSTDHKMTSDDLYNMWSVASRAKSAIVQGRRLENLSWRLWYTSTIRSKIEMEEKRRKSCELNDEDINIHDEIFIETETENESNSCTSSSPNSKNKRKVKSNKKKKESALVLPSDRPLFTSTCTSILAEIQDASFRFSTTSGGGINQYNFYTTLSHGHHYNTHTNSNTHNNSNNTNNSNNQVHIISPPTNRSKSPGNSISSSTNLTPKRKKNVEKFLKKFKSNLEDISEQLDEKLNFSDEETGGEERIKEKNEDNLNNNNNPDNNTNNIDACIKSLSPTLTVSSNHFATDEEGQFSSFYTRDGINIEKSQKTIKKKNQPSMISKLLKKEITVESSGSSFSLNSIRNQATNFLFNDNNEGDGDGDGDGNGDGINNIISLKNQIFNLQQSEIINEKRIIDANALSTSLSASKFKLEDEFDSQLVIW